MTEAKTSRSEPHVALEAARDEILAGRIRRADPFLRTQPYLMHLEDVKHHIRAWNAVRRDEPYYE